MIFTNAPKNRHPKKLEPLDVAVRDADGEHVFTPNTIMMAGFAGDDSLRKLRPMDGHRSILSNGQAVTYRAGDLSISLTPEELDRLVMLCLTPREYFTLLHFYGMAHEWHEDFYDTETGEAMQPKLHEDDETGAGIIW